MNIIFSGVVGLFVGLITYYLTELFFKPYIKYKDIVYEIDMNLVYYDNANYLLPFIVEEEGSSGAHSKKVEEGKKIHRQTAGKLRAAYFHLPALAKWYLKKKKVDPLEASKSLIGLSNTYDQPKDERYRNEVRLRKHLRMFDIKTGEQLSF